MSSAKRKHVEYPEDATVVKKPKVIIEVSSILNLSDCTLLILLSYLDATSLYFLSQ